jgi:hypothetical protein
MCHIVIKIEGDGGGIKPCLSATPVIGLLLSHYLKRRSEVRTVESPNKFLTWPLLA